MEIKIQLKSGNKVILTTLLRTWLCYAQPLELERRPNLRTVVEKKIKAEQFSTYVLLAAFRQTYSEKWEQMEIE